MTAVVAGGMFGVAAMSKYKWQYLPAGKIRSSVLVLTPSAAPNWISRTVANPHPPSLATVQEIQIGAAEGVSTRTELRIFPRSAELVGCATRCGDRGAASSGKDLEPKGLRIAVWLNIFGLVFLGFGPEIDTGTPPPSRRGLPGTSICTKIQPRSS